MSIRFQNKSIYLVMIAAAMFVSVALFTLVFFRGIDDLPTSKPIARKHASLRHDGTNTRLVNAYKKLSTQSTYRMIQAAITVGEHGEPDEATEAIIDFIENREEVTAEDSDVLKDRSVWYIASIQSGGYKGRLRSLIALGLTKTERAEEFLVNAYRNPHSVVANRKYRQLDQEQEVLGNHDILSPIEVDQMTWGSALLGLLLLDEPKYSLVLEEDYYSSAAVAEKNYEKENPRGTVEDFNQLSRFGILLDILVRRDIIRDRAPEGAISMLDSDAFQQHWGEYSGRYWNSETNTAVPRQ